MQMSICTSHLGNLLIYIALSQLDILYYLQAPEVRDGLFQFFIDVRSVLKGRLPRKLLISRVKITPACCDMH